MSASSRNLICNLVWHWLKPIPPCRSDHLRSHRFSVPIHREGLLTSNARIVLNGRVGSGGAGPLSRRTRSEADRPLSASFGLTGRPVGMTGVGGLQLFGFGERVRRKQTLGNWLEMAESRRSASEVSRRKSGPAPIDPNATIKVPTYSAESRRDCSRIVLAEGWPMLTLFLSQTSGYSAMGRDAESILSVALR